MSRIGKKPISIPAGVKVAHDTSSRTVRVEGPQGKLAFAYRPEVTVEYKEGEKQIQCSIPEDQMKVGQTRAFWGTTRVRIQIMMDGVTKGYARNLEVVGVGWNVKLQGKTLQLNVGYCNPINVAVPDGLVVAVEGANKVSVKGPDKQLVGQFAAQVRSKRKPEPYNGKGIKYSDEVITRKAGKAFGS